MSVGVSQAAWAAPMRGRTLLGGHAALIELHQRVLPAGELCAESATLVATDDPLAFVVESGRSAGERLTFLQTGGAVDGLTLGGWPLVRLVPARAPKNG